MPPPNYKAYEDERFARQRDFFVYEAFVDQIAPAGVAADTIQIQADADFIWQKSTYEADDAGAAQTDATRVIPLVLIQITDTGSNRQLFFNPIPIVNVFGTGRVPFILPNPRLFIKTSTIQIDFTSFEAADDRSVRLSFIGYKFYRY